MSGKISLIILSLVAPFLLVLLEAGFPYPAPIEETVKWVLLSWWMKSVKTKKSDWIYAGVGGFVFAVNESMLYLNKILMTGNWWIFPQRLLLTGILHSTTMILMFWGIKKNKWVGLLSLLTAIIIHWGFNVSMKLWF